MIHIVGLLLKTIGWISLGILGVILGLLLLILFSAICYRIEGKKQGKPEGQVKIAWLLRILSVVVTYKEGLQIRLRLFGRTVWKLEPGKEAGDRTDGDESGELPGTETGEGLEPKGTPEPKGAPEPDKVLEAEGAQEPGEALEPEEPPKPAGKEAVFVMQEPSGSLPGDDPAWEKPGQGGFLDRLWGRICGLYQKLLALIRSLYEKVEETGERIGQAREKWERLKTYLQDPANHRSARRILEQAKKCLRHILPRKGRASVVFGLEDPYQMGQVLSAAAFLYPFTHRLLSLRPVFDEKILEGEIQVKGHIRLGVLLGYMLRLLLDQNIRRQVWKLVGSFQEKRRG